MSDSQEDRRAAEDSDVESSAGWTAPEDSILAKRLGAPDQPRDIYLEEASVYRPVATGDIFQDVVVPGATPEESVHGLTMVIAHPSVMRRGAALEPRARAAPVATANGLRRSQWTPGHYDVFPLPLLSTVARDNGFEIANRGWGALLQVAAPIQTTQLSVSRRVVCLSPKGIHLLLQQIVHADTRVPVREDHLAHIFQPKLEELEMLQPWNEELVAPLVDAGGDLIAELQRGAREFEAMLGEVHGSDGRSLRALLESDGADSGEVQRRFYAEVSRRRVLLSDDGGG